MGFGSYIKICGAGGDGGYKPAEPLERTFFPSIQMTSCIQLLDNLRWIMAYLSMKRSIASVRQDADK